jgi:hypothetical protein
MATCILGEFLSARYRLTYEHMLLVESMAWYWLLIGTVFVLVGSIGLSFTMPGRTAVLMGMAVVTLSLSSPLFVLSSFQKILNIHSWGVIFVVIIPVGLSSGGFLIIAGFVRLLKQFRVRQRPTRGGSEHIGTVNSPGGGGGRN